MVQQHSSFLGFSKLCNKCHCISPDTLTVESPIQFQRYLQKSSPRPHTSPFEFAQGSFSVAFWWTRPDCVLPLPLVCFSDFSHHSSNSDNQESVCKYFQLILQSRYLQTFQVFIRNIFISVIFHGMFILLHWDSFVKRILHHIHPFTW